MSTISLRKAGKQYGATEIIGDLNLEIADGEFVVIVGPSGQFLKAGDHAQQYFESSLLTHS
ncbi:ABC-type phosphate/phosphonate transport system ATPase subunit [Mesorhizobium soli]|uniref:hypothetical protein n=1 Tax=Pseudaminobacter soli (ex Li et al. 2025) TaxID=1295366 RepID=UPI002473DD6B|nr:hypothetical protein [Mesorhizobium soli]MDH6231705.1 ABC-type phosphate/phosphonate transport system ATPase subunit [Mesorhizobium soli]